MMMRQLLFGFLIWVIHTSQLAWQNGHADVDLKPQRLPLVTSAHMRCPHSAVHDIMNMMADKGLSGMMQNRHNNQRNITVLCWTSSSYVNLFSHLAFSPCVMYLQPITAILEVRKHHSQDVQYLQGSPK